MPPQWNFIELRRRPLLRILQGPREECHVLGYVDDICLFEGSDGELQSSIDVLIRSLSRLGLSLNINKCKTAHIASGNPRIRLTNFRVNQQPIPSLGEFDVTKYLGKPVGLNLFPDVKTIDEFIDAGKSLLTSYLASWQRIDALKTFQYPAFNYLMRLGQLRIGDWKHIDTTLRPFIKKTLYLPDKPRRITFMETPKMAYLAFRCVHTMPTLQGGLRFQAALFSRPIRQKSCVG